ncbi:hypothetical protein VmeM32_00208 [Vibrio phage vB_VmeM-32]|nr:hypothetical protein VmeM32_00208 [Vibrio phage vB_VmeM-32]
MSKKTSPAKKAAYTRYKFDDKAAVNKQIKRARHTKNHPNDILSKDAKATSTRFGYKGPSKQRKLSSRDCLHAQLDKLVRPAIKALEPKTKKA